MAKAKEQHGVGSCLGPSGFVAKAKEQHGVGSSLGPTGVAAKTQATLSGQE